VLRLGTAQAQNLAELSALYLTRWPLGHPIHDQDPTWNLERCQMFAQERLQLGGSNIGLRARHDNGRNLLTEAGMRKTERGGFRNIGMPQQHLIDLERRDLLAASIDLLLEPPGEHEISVGIESALVAGAKPAVDERLGIGCAVRLVPAHNRGTADHDLAGFARGEKVARFVQNSDPGTGW
jgi:hypothetical protein